jgi:hypothetical protein
VGSCKRQWTKHDGVHDGEHRGIAADGEGQQRTRAQKKDRLVPKSAGRDGDITDDGEHEGAYRPHMY